MIILAHADSPEASPTFVVPFQRALQRCIDFCKACPEEAFSCYLKYNTDRSAKTNLWQAEAWRITVPLLANNQIIDPEVIKIFYNWQVSQGIIKKPFNFQELITLP